jgi:hypothetical protein
MSTNTIQDVSQQLTMIWHSNKHHGQNALHGGPALKRASLSSIEQSSVTSDKLNGAETYHY